LHRRRTRGLGLAPGTHEDGTEEERVKILHLLYSFPPDPAGGTEIYVERLSRDLSEFGIDSVIVAPGPREAEYEWRGLRVRRIASRAVLPIDVLYAGTDTDALSSFAHVLEEEAPDVLHQHAFTAACSIDAARLARRSGVPVVFTYHSPTVTCERGTLLK